MKSKSLSTIEANFLLNNDNYKFKSSIEFRQNFETFRQKNLNRINLFPTVSLAKKSPFVSLKIGCYFAGIRFTTISKKMIYNLIN